MHALLLGAGFSRNWGGWLANEVMGELLGRLVHDRETYSLLRKTRNFEDALSQMQADARTHYVARDPRLARMEQAILATFGEMNQVFARKPGMEFSKTVSRVLAS